MGVSLVIALLLTDEMGSTLRASPPVGSRDVPLVVLETTLDDTFDAADEDASVVTGTELRLPFFFSGGRTARTCVRDVPHLARCINDQ